MESGEDVLLLDVRRGSWGRSDVKAKGALRIPPDEVESRLDEIPKNKLIVTYCT
jgi:rhodanese-related sulfurtransferase